MKRPRHLQTVAGVTWRRRATTLLSVPSAHAKMMRARRATWGTERERCASESSRCRSSSVKINATFGRPVRMLPPCRAVRAGRAICFTFYRDTTLGQVQSLAIHLLRTDPEAAHLVENLV